MRKENKLYNITLSISLQEGKELIDLLIQDR